MRINIIIFSAIIFLISCQISEKKTDKVDNEINMDLFWEQDLSKMGERALKNTNINRIRIIQYNPFGMDTYITNVIKYDDSYSISDKVVATTILGYEYIETVKRRSKLFYEPIWSKAVKELQNVDYKRLDSKKIGDRSLVVIESNIGGEYRISEFILCDSTSWISNIMYRLTEGRIRLTIPDTQCE